MSGAGAGEAQSLSCFIVLGQFDSITTRFFGVPAARFHLFSFYCFVNKYDSRSLKCFSLSTLPIASSRLCWGVYNRLEYDKFASRPLTLFYMCASQSCGPCRRNQSNCQQSLKLFEFSAPRAWFLLHFE